MDAKTIMSMGRAIAKSQADDRKKTVPYRRQYTKIAGSVTAALLLQQINYWWHNTGRAFFKFKEKCEHEWCKDGDSWCEELGFTKHEFNGAIKRIGTKITKGVSKSDALKDSVVIYWTDSNRVTWYQVNEELLGAYIYLAYNSPDPPPISQKAIYLQTDTLPHTLNDEFFAYLYSETTTEKTTDKKTSGKKMPDQTPTPKPITQSTSPDTTQPTPHPPIPDTSTSVQEPVAVAPKPDESLATRKEPLFLADIEKKLAGEAAMYTNAQAAAPPPPCPGCTFLLSGPCDPEKCDCACHQEQGEADPIGDPFWVEPPLEAEFLAGEAPPFEGMVDKSGVPVSDATRKALRDVMSTPVGLPDDPCDEQFTELVNVLDSALASDDVSDRVKGIFRDARDKLTPVGKSGVAGPLPDDDPRYEVPFQDAGGRAGSAVVNNLASGMESAVIPPAQPSTVGIAPVSVAISAPVELTKKQIAALAFDLEAYFCEIAGLKTPNRSTAYFAKKAHVRWGNPCKEMMRLADYDLAKAKRIMDAAWAEVVKDNWQGKISTAQSIENYFGAQARGPGKAVEMPSGPLGLTKAQQNTCLFGQRNGKK